MIRYIGWRWAAGLDSGRWLLLGHLAAAFLFVSGGVTAGVGQVAAIRARRPSEVVLLLGVVRVAVVFVAVGALATLAFGLAVASHLGLPDSLVWLRLAVGLWIASIVLGAAGGRRGRQARYLAGRLASAGDLPSPELRRAVADPAGLALSALSFACVLAILVLMVWRPA